MITKKRRSVTAAIATLAVLMITGQAVRADLPNAWTPVGNDNGTRAGHTPQSIDDLYVAPDGKSYWNTAWDEHWNSGTRWDTNGTMLNRLTGWSQGAAGGLAITANDTYIYIGHGGWQSNPVKGLYRDNLNGTAATSGALANKDVTGVAATNTEVYASNLTDNKVHVFDASLTPIRSWTVTAPNKICLGASGTIWVIAGRAIRHYNTATGADLRHTITLPNHGIPADICVDNTGRLLVADKGPDSNIKIYTNLTTTPTLSTTFGVTKGAWQGSGASIGTSGPLRFEKPTGVGADSNGNIWVACAGVWPGTIVEKYTPSGTLLWWRKGLEFLTVGAIDPSSETDVYTQDKHYVIDYSQPAESNWTYKGRTVNPDKYPGDPRALTDGDNGNGMALVRRIQGKKFLISTPQAGAVMEIYRFNSAVDGETAIPSVYLEEGTTETNFSIKTDTNGDGSFSASENKLVTASGGFGWYMDTNGDIWIADGTNTRRFRMQGLDTVGNPIYNNANITTYQMPNTGIWQDQLRVIYIPETDTLYMSGYTDAYPSNITGAWGLAGRVIYRYDGWDAGSRTIHAGYPIVLPSDGADWNVYAAKAIAVAGSYIFTAGGRRPYIKVYNNSTGAYVGEITPPSEINNDVGSIEIDSLNAITAHQRSNGEYVVMTENAGGARFNMYRWFPTTGAKLPAAPAGLTATGGNTQVALSWNASSGATSYTVKRSTSEGSGYVNISSPTGTTYTDTGLTNGTTYYFVVSASNSAGTSGNSGQASATPVVSTTYRKITGTAYGSASVGDVGPAGAFDDDTASGYASSVTNGFVGIDAGAARVVKRIKFYSDSGWETMAGGKFQGSNTSGISAFKTLYTVPRGYATNTLLTVDLSKNTRGYRWIRFKTAGGKYCEVMETEYYTLP